jgi:hypothetical protein
MHASQQDAEANVAFGSISAEIRRLRHVRSAPNNGLMSDIEAGRFRAMCGRLRVGKENLHERSIGRCSHVFGLLMRFP